MEFSIKALPAEKAVSGCIVVGVYADGKLAPAAVALDAAVGGAIKAAVKSGDMSGKRGSTLLLRSLAGIKAVRVLLAGLGKEEDFGERAYADVVRAALKALAATAAADAFVTLPELPVAQRDEAWKLRQVVLIARSEGYRFDQTKGKKEPAEAKLKRLDLPADKAGAKRADAAVRQAQAVANGMELTKTLGNLPGNICTPTYLADAAKKLGKEWKLKVDVLERKQIEALKMGSFLSVAKGSDEPPKFIVLRYDGAAAVKGKQAAPIVLVGKGITFDSGGISIKPAASMDEMKYDMCGAASVLGTLRAVAELGLKLNVVGLIAACENMPSGRANKPGDVVTSMSGQTIEILNTDAEGRLILCDALTYAERFKPAAVVDIATLTGACVTALGHINSGLFSKDDALANELLAAAKETGDPAWRMPLDEDYQEQLKSNFADMANIGGPPGGAITAACFLSRYTGAYAWAHLDIAGTAWKGGAAKGATGRPVPLLTQFMIDRAR
jgi:leucyl aminopeptidase